MAGLDKIKSQILDEAKVTADAKIEDAKAQAEQMALDAQSLTNGSEITMYFSFGSYNLGTAFAQSGCTFSNFDPASVWIK